MVIAAVKIGNENLLSLSRTDVHIDFSAQIRAVYTNRCFVISHKIHNFTSLSAPVIRGGLFLSLAFRKQSIGIKTSELAKRLI